MDDDTAAVVLTRYEYCVISFVCAMLENFAWDKVPLEKIDRADDDMVRRAERMAKKLEGAFDND